MPVYLCKPGWASSEPWRHGVQVYAYPFKIDEGNSSAITGGSSSVSGGTSSSSYQQYLHHPQAAAAAAGTAAAAATGNQGRPVNEGTEGWPVPRLNNGEDDTVIADNRSTPADVVAAAAAAAAAGVPVTSNPIPSQPPTTATTTTDAPMAGLAVRRVRHAEVVLVDEVSIAYGRYWLRLRWPGPQGGFAGYIALGSVRISTPKIVSKASALTQEDRGGKIEMMDEDAPAEAQDVEVEAEEVEGESGRALSRSQLSEESDNLPPSPILPEGETNFLSPTPRTTTEDSKSSAGGSIVLNHRATSPTPSDEQDENATSSHPSSPTSSSKDTPHPLKKCESTGLYFPSSTAMELMAMYDDGLEDMVQTCTVIPEDGSSGLGLTGSSSSSFLRHGLDTTGEPVFCRICREGLHDVNYDLDPVTGGSKHQSDAIIMPPPPPVAAAAGMDAGGRPAVIRHNNEGLRQRAVGYQRRDQPEGMEEERAGTANAGNTINYAGGAAASAAASAQERMIQQHPNTTAAAAAAAASRIITRHPTAENPLLAPCECSGSMAFVHYLCVEQWRCRSRHPAARNGLNCETCGGEYTLPPPPSRPASRRSGDGPDGAGAGAGVFADEDWLEAMPAHVLAALRRPHPWWQIGAAIVRRRWLRPIAPVIVSPVVALYCRARRTLKKRGVSRRRWACSLCRRRARWKCVRCLRSYYCSRQCQNVSWHIVHKHVCYKPTRFWWSVVVYGVGTIMAFPGILRDPLIYDLGLSFIPASFLIMGIIGGGIATALKKGFGVDIRGRLLEVIVVVCTIWLAMISWGLVWSFFGVSDQCWGVFGQWSEDISVDNNEMRGLKIISPLLHGMRKFLFNPARVWFSMCNRAAAKTGPMARWICSAENFVAEDGTGCFQTAGNANPDFFLPEHNGEKCAADLVTVASFWGAASTVLVAGSILKRRERDRRAAGRAGGRARAGRNVGEPRPHQD